MKLSFLFEFFRHPINTGAVAPSSKNLARRMVSGIGLSSAEVVVEYGPGTGAFTGEILKRLKKDALFCAIEKNPKMSLIFRKTFPDANLFEDSASNIRNILKTLGADKADCILCGLPWASFNDDLQDSILSATLDILPEGGKFATFAYLQGLLLPAGRKFRRRLHDSFSEVKTSSTAWLNLPPAFVYRCTK